MQLGGMLSLSFPSDVAAAAPEVRLSVLTRDDVDAAGCAISSLIVFKGRRR